MTAVSEGSTEASSPASWSRSATSQAATRTRAPIPSSSATSSAAPAAARPRRLTSTSDRTPRPATRWRANSAPRPLVPPVISTVPSRSKRLGRTGPCRPREAGGQQTACAHGQLGLVKPRQRAQVRVIVVLVEVDKTEPTRVLGLRAPYQAPHRGLDQVGGLAADADSVPGDDRQARVGQLRAGQPALQQRKSDSAAACTNSAGSVPGAGTGAAVRTTSGTAAPAASASLSAPRSA